MQRVDGRKQIAGALCVSQKTVETHRANIMSHVDKILVMTDGMAHLFGAREDVMRRLGMRVYYGDATRPDMLHTAGGSHARLLVIALDTPEKTLEVVQTARRHFPELEILARAFDWRDAHELLAAGVTHVYREALDKSGAFVGLLQFREYFATPALRSSIWNTTVARGGTRPLPGSPHARAG